MRRAFRSRSGLLPMARDVVVYVVRGECFRPIGHNAVRPTAFTELARVAETLHASRSSRWPGPALMNNSGGEGRKNHPPPVEVELPDARRFMDAGADRVSRRPQHRVDADRPRRV